MKKLSLLALLLVGCSEEPPPTTCQNGLKPNRTEEKLFATMQNGCEISEVSVVKNCFYRGPTLYVSSCKGSVEYTTGGKSKHQVITETQ